VDGITAEVYEIKPAHLFGLGFAELVGYIGILDANDPEHRNWTAGSSYKPPSKLFVDKFGGYHVFVAPPVAGVIAYLLVRRLEFTIDILILAGFATRSSTAATSTLSGRIGLATAFRF
jgi:hypothetical protein